MKNLIFFIPMQCFLPFVKIPSGSMISVAWRCMPPGVLQGAKSPVLLGLMANAVCFMMIESTIKTEGNCMYTGNSVLSTYLLIRKLQPMQNKVVIV